MVVETSVRRTFGGATRRIRVVVASVVATVMIGGWAISSGPAASADEQPLTYGAISIRDADDAPVVGVTVLIRRDTCESGNPVWSSKTSWRADALGAFAFSLTPGSYCAEVVSVPTGFQPIPPRQFTVGSGRPAWVTSWIPGHSLTAARRQYVGVVAARNSNSAALPHARIRILEGACGAGSKAVWDALTSDRKDAFGVFAYSLPAGDYCATSVAAPTPYATAQSTGFRIAAGATAGASVNMWLPTSVVGVPEDPGPLPATLPPPPVATSPTPTPTPTPPIPSTGGGLVVHHGDLTVSVPGTVIDSMDVRGVVRIHAANVTISNSIVRGAASGINSSVALIQNTAGYPGLTIVDTEIAPTVVSTSGAQYGILGYNFTATRVHLHDLVDMVHITGDNVTVQNSVLRDNSHWENDPRVAGTPTHDDSIQIQRGRNIRILNNVISGAHNSGIQVTQDQGLVSDIVFAGNRADGGGCTFNVAEKGKGPIAGIVIRDNTFGRTTKVMNCAVIAPLTSTPQVERNFYTDGAAVSVRRGA